jgi:hypothetical protein
MDYFTSKIEKCGENHGGVKNKGSDSMAKISIEDMVESGDDGKKTNTGKASMKEKKKGGPFSFDAGKFIEKMKKITWEQILQCFKNINIYRKIRESLVGFYLSRTASVDKKNLIISWQPLFLIIVKIAVVAFLSYKIWELHPIVGNWFKIGLDFFKLHEIYNFRFPARSFFDTVAGYLFLIVLGYHGLYFLYHQLQDLFSVLALSKADEKIFYIRNLFLKKDLYIFSIPDIALVVLKQNILYRLLGLGTISLQKRSGEQIVIRSIRGATRMLKELTEMKRAYDSEGIGETSS